MKVEEILGEAGFNKQKRNVFYRDFLILPQNTRLIEHLEFIVLMYSLDGKYKDAIEYQVERHAEFVRVYYIVA